MLDIYVNGKSLIFNILNKAENFKQINRSISIGCLNVLSYGAAIWMLLTADDLDSPVKSLLAR